MEALEVSPTRYTDTKNVIYLVPTSSERQTLGEGADLLKNPSELRVHKACLDCPLRERYRAVGEDEDLLTPKGVPKGSIEARCGGVYELGSECVAARMEFKKGPYQPKISSPLALPCGQDPLELYTDLLKIPVEVSFKKP